MVALLAEWDTGASAHQTPDPVSLAKTGFRALLHNTTATDPNGFKFSTGMYESLAYMPMEFQSNNISGCDDTKQGVKRGFRESRTRSVDTFLLFVT